MVANKHRFHTEKGFHSMEEGPMLCLNPAGAASPINPKGSPVMTTNTDNALSLVTDLSDAYRAGTAAWEDDAAGIYAFRGAVRAAMDTGYQRDTPEYRVFLAAYIDGIEQTTGGGVSINSDGFVVL